MPTETADRESIAEPLAVSLRDLTDAADRIRALTANTEPGYRVSMAVDDGVTKFTACMGTRLPATEWRCMEGTSLDDLVTKTVALWEECGPRPTERQAIEARAAKLGLRLVEAG